MPIIIDDNLASAEAVAEAAQQQSAVTPKFFSSKLTGSDGKAGLLNSALRPINTATNTAYAASRHIEVKANHTQNDITTTTLPMNPLLRRAIEEAGTSLTLPIPAETDRFVVATGSDDYEIFFDLVPQGATMYEDKSGDQGTHRDFVVQYRCELVIVPKDQVQSAERAQVNTSGTGLGRTPRPTVVVTWDSSPMKNAASWIASTLGTMGLPFQNIDELDEWMIEYSVYQRITALAEIWADDGIADVVGTYLSERAAGGSEFEIPQAQMRYLENYKVTLDAYRAIHSSIAKAFGPFEAQALAKQNLSLLMNSTVDDLEKVKTQLAVPGALVRPYMPPTFLSKQQLAAVLTHEPLSLAQAAAGTGKSTVILQRIEYLEACGVQPGDITVLSFTNAAADNIIEKRPGVGSMTISKMINDIYQLNHPTHQVSSIETIINSLEIFFPLDQTARRFGQLLLHVKQGKPSASANLNNFVEDNYDTVIRLLDSIKQTSLELEIIVCYQMIDTMIEPAHVQCKHLIIDEVQDNSIFEFIYLLKYVTKHRQSLFIVGDASQTLYEFRAADPRALNTLEASGIFAAYRMTTNYRSNQEILDFANVVLGDLETNKFANLQMQANSLAVPTADTFQDKVRLRFVPTQHLSKFRSDELPALMQNVVLPDYVDHKLAAGEQVAFLAYSREDVKVMQETLERRYPDKHIASLVSDRPYSTDIFSVYIKKSWNNVLQVPPSNAAFAATQDVLQNLDSYTKNASNPKVRAGVLKMMQDWWMENEPTIQAWVNECNIGALRNAEFFDRLRDNMLSYEIRKNAINQTLTGQRNRERKEQNSKAKPDLVVSTIHGVKGLEFDNVVVLHKDDQKLSQVDQRLYYVAFTRAMKSEFILSYGKIAKPPIESAYQQIVHTLEEREKQAAIQASGVMPGALDDSDITSPSTLVDQEPLAVA